MYVNYTAKSAQVSTSLLTSCNNLLQQDDIRMRSHGLRQLVDYKFVASCQQTCCKLIIVICHQQACCKLFQQVVTSLQMTRFRRLLPLDENYKFVVTQLVKLQQAGGIDNLQQVCGVFSCVYQHQIVVFDHVTFFSFKVSVLFPQNKTE